MKKFISAFMAFALAFQAAPCVMPAVYAAEAEDASMTELMSKVLTHIKTRIGDTSKYDLFESNYQTLDYDTTNEPYYQFDFEWSNSKTDEDLSISFCVTDKDDIENKGYVTEYSKSESSKPKEPQQIKLSDQIANKDKYIKTAQSFTDSINPNIKGQYIASMPHQVSPTDINIDRYENSLPVSDQHGNITLSDDGNEVIKFDMYGYDPEAVFPPVDSIIDKNEAPTAYKTAIPLNLKYFTRYNKETEKREIYTAYVPDFSKGRYMNALTGEPFKASEPQNIMATAAKSASANGDEGAEDEYDLSEAEKGEIENMEGILTKKEVDSLLRNNPSFSLSGYYMASFSAYNYGKDGEKRINCRFSKIAPTESNDSFFSARFVLDAETGEIKSFYRSCESSDNVDENTTYKDLPYLTSKAETIAKALAGNKYEEYKLKEISEDAPILYSKLENTDFYGHSEYARFNFSRYVNGIPFEEDKLSLSFDPVTGELLSYSITYFAPPSDFPTAKVKLSAADAYDRVFSSPLYDFELAYIAVRTTEDSKKAYLPAYYISGSSTSYYGNTNIFVDANTGKFLYYDGSEMKEAVTGEYTDIANSPYKNEIIALASAEKGFEGTKFEPEKEITFDELKKLIFYSDDKYKKEPESIVTKADLAYIVSLDIADKKLLSADIYKDIYSDVADNKGSAAIAVLYGFLTADGDKFEPEKAVTREEAAHAAYMFYTKEYK